MANDGRMLNELLAYLGVRSKEKRDEGNEKK